MKYEYVKPLLMAIDPEMAHNIAEMAFKTAKQCPLFFNPLIKENFVIDKKLEQNLLGLTFKNPVGLAAGFDKNATMIHGLLSLGVGFAEVGAITPIQQKGNEKPRLWRHIEEESIQNAFGFNNDGMEMIAYRLNKVYPFVIPIGANIGKNKTTKEEDAIEDYKKLVTTLKDVVDFFVINISSPNTPNLRDLLNEEFINNIFTELKALTTKPILIKFSPDMSEEDAKKLARASVNAKCDGIIATNTTVDYSVVKNPQNRGGISGKALKEKSFKIFKAIAEEVYGETILISVGGIDSAEEAYKRIRYGANLIQIFSGIMYKGPGLAGDINRGIVEFMRRDGFNHISEVIGVDLNQKEDNE